MRKVNARHPERRSLEGSSYKMLWMLRRHAPQHDVNAASRHLESFDYAQHDVTIKTKAKARSFCQTIEIIKDRNENQMPGESRLVPLRDCCNGCALVGFNGFRYSHRNQNLIIRKLLGKILKEKNFAEICSKTLKTLHFLSKLTYVLHKM